MEKLGAQILEVRFQCRLRFLAVSLALMTGRSTSVRRIFKRPLGAVI
jgi:hypothetical protein